MINAKTHRKFEKAAGMKFVAIFHRGHWGYEANCASTDGLVYDVNRKTGRVILSTTTYYRDGKFFLTHGPITTPESDESFVRGIAREWAKAYFNYWKQQWSLKDNA